MRGVLIQGKIWESVAGCEVIVAAAAAAVVVSGQCEHSHRALVCGVRYRQNDSSGKETNVEERMERIGQTDDSYVVRADHPSTVFAITAHE